MRNIEEFIINKVVVNILDKENNRVIFSGQEVELTEEVYGYFEKHIQKLLKDEDARPAGFDGERNIVQQLCQEIFEDEGTFLDNTGKMAQYLFKCISNDEKEGSGDFAACLFESQDGRYLTLLKLNFTDAYCHYVKEVDGKPGISVGVSKTGLPGPGQRVSKAVIIKDSKDAEAFNLLVADRDWDGVFNQAFLKCCFVRDERENTKIIHKASEQFARKVFKDNAQEAERFRSKMSDILRNEENVNIEKIADESFNDPVVKNEFKATMVNEGIQESEVAIDREWAEKKLKRKRLKVDKSIELYIDSEVYNDKEKFQIKRNGDGTIDIILKNVKNYIER